MILCIRFKKSDFPKCFRDICWFLFHLFCIAPRSSSYPALFCCQESFTSQHWVTSANISKNHRLEWRNETPAIPLIHCEKVSFCLEVELDLSFRKQEHQASFFKFTIRYLSFVEIIKTLIVCFLLFIVTIIHLWKGHIWNALIWN